VERLTESEVIAALAARGVFMSPKKLKTYRMRGFIERPEQIHVAGVRGSKSLYPASVVDELESLERAGRNKGLRRSTSGRAFIAWLTAITANARKNRSLLNALRDELESTQATTKHSPPADFIFNPPDVQDPRYKDRLDEGLALSESVAELYRKDVRPLINFVADMTFVSEPIHSKSDDGLPKDARPSELLRISYLVNDDTIEQARLLLRRAYFVMKFYAQITAKKGMPLEHVRVLELLAPIGMLKTYFGSIDAFFAKIGPMAVLWLANQYRTGNETWLKPIELFIHPFEEAMLSLPEGQRAEFLAPEIPCIPAKDRAFAPKPLP